MARLTWAEAWAQARIEGIEKMERKALKKSKGAEIVIMRAYTLKDLGMLLERGWAVMPGVTATAAGVGVNSYVLQIGASVLKERLDA